MNSAIDTYIDNASETTQPILRYLRELILAATPSITENIKWNAPSYEYEGKIVCNIMAFKKHVNWMFHRGKELQDTHNAFIAIGEKSNMMGLKQIEKVTDLPEDSILIAFIRQAVALEKK